MKTVYLIDESTIKEYLQAEDFLMVVGLSILIGIAVGLCVFVGF